MGKHGTYGGASSLGGGNFNNNTKFLKEGSNLYRILPPFGSLSGDEKTKGQIAKYWAVTWVPGSDGRRRPVVSILKTKRQGKAPFICIK